MHDMKVDTDEQKIDELLTRGVVEVIDAERLRERMRAGEQLRIKLGIDPTSKHIHLGRSVAILKLKDFQELGHQIVLIIGDMTGVIGDTSDKDAERPMLSNEAIEDNKKHYFDQLAKIIDMSRVEFRYNSEWLAGLGYHEIGEQADLFSVADFIARENIKKRLDAGKRVSLREVLYPLMQGYDSVAIRADVEIGGSDQRFNNLAGRTMQPHFDQKPQAILLGPIINGTDGRKMSSSWGNTITLTMEPSEMFGKVMSMRDEEILSYFTNCTRAPLSKIAEIEKELNAGANPRDAKMELAYELVRMYHGEDHAISAKEDFIDTFQKGGIPDDVMEIVAPYVDELIRAEVIASKGELRRLIDAGGVRDAETGEKLTAIPDSVEDPIILKIGKRRFVKLK